MTLDNKPPSASPASIDLTPTDPQDQLTFDWKDGAVGRPDVTTLAAEPNAQSVEAALLLGFQPTTVGPTIQKILAKAVAWAGQLGHAEVSIDHVLFVLSTRDGGAQALTDAGVLHVHQLEEQLLRVVYGTSASSTGKPIVSNALYALVHHAQAFCRQKGRAEGQIQDLIDALHFVTINDVVATTGVNMLRQHWPKVSAVNPVLSLLQQVRTEQAEQTRIARACLATSEMSSAAIVSKVESVQAQLASASEQIGGLDTITLKDGKKMRVLLGRA